MTTLSEREKYVFGTKGRLFVAAEKQIWLIFRETKRKRIHVWLHCLYCWNKGSITIYQEKYNSFQTTDFARFFTAQLVIQMTLGSVADNAFDYFPQIIYGNILIVFFNIMILWKPKAWSSVLTGWRHFCRGLR